MSKKKILALLLVCVLAISVFAGCTGSPASSSSKTPAGVSYPGTAGKDSFTFNIGSEPPEIFSVKTTDTTSLTVLRHLMEPLVILGKEDEVLPGVAESWTISDDKLVYTFKIRQNAKWSNGDPVTAKDFEYAWKCLLDPAFAADYSYFAYILKNGEAYANGTAKAEDVGVKATSDYELVVTLERPTSYALSMFAFGVFNPLNEKAYAQFGDSYGKDADKIVTNGMYKLESWQHESEMVWVKNADYWDAANVKVEKIIGKMITDTNAAMNEFKAGGIDMIGLNGEQMAMIKGEGYPVQSYDDGSAWYIEFNLNENVLANKNIRTAFAYAVDGESFTKNVVKNNSVRATSFTPPAINGGKFTEAVGKIFMAPDSAKAKAALEAGLKELGITADKLDLTMICDDTDTAQRYAAFFIEQWKTVLGVDVKVEPMPFKSRLERLSQKNFSMVLAGWGPDFNDPMTFLDLFETGNGNNHTSYTNPEYDKLLSEIRDETDDAKRTEKLVALDKIICDDLMVAPVYWRKRDYVTSEKLTGVVRTAFSDIYFRWAEVK